MELQQKHLDGAILLADRMELLDRIPKGGTSCEIGVAAGDYSRAILDKVRPVKHYMVDSWTHVGRYDEAMYHDVLRDFADDIATNRVSIIRNISYRGLMSVPDKSLDFIYIDTSHSYKDTKLELEVARDKITPDGIIAGHDYRVGRYDAKHFHFIEYGVIQAVNEFVVQYDFAVKYMTFESNQFYSFALQKRA